MRILLTCDKMDCGGVETHIYELARALRRLGEEVCVLSSGGALADALEAEGIRQIRVELCRRGVRSLIRARRQIARVLDEGFDVVHAHTRMSAFLAARAAAARGICLVTTIHAHFAVGRLRGRLARWGSAAIAVSDDLYFYLLENASYLGDANITVIKNGIDLKAFCPERLEATRGTLTREEKEEGELTLLFMSRLDGDCSAVAYSLCRIAERLRARNTRLRIVIGGGGSEYARINAICESLCRRLGARAAEAVGRVDDVVRALAVADVFIGASRAAMEAMACGIPTVIAGDEGFGGVADERTFGRCEYTNFCARGEEKISDGALYFALCRLLSMSEDERRALGARAREHIVRHHSAEAMAERTVALYRRAVKRERSRRTRGGVLLCGYYGYGNVGDELMQRAAAQRIEARGEEVCVLTRRGRRDSQGACAYCVCRRDPIAVIRALRRADRVIFGGGTLLQNDTSRRSLAYYLFIIRLAEKMGKRTELWGNGIGEIRGRLSRRAVARALADCSYVGLRDKGSAARLCRIFGECGTACVPQASADGELVMSEPFARELLSGTDGVLWRLGLSEGKKFFVLALSGRARGSVQRSIMGFARGLAKRGMTPVITVMYPREDLRLSRRACGELGGVLAYPLGARDLASLMRGAELVCGARYHALVLSALVGTAFIGFGGERDDKLSDFCTSHGGIFFTPAEKDR